MREVVQKSVLCIAILLLGLIAVAGVGAIGIRGAADDIYTAPPARSAVTQAAFAPPSYDAKKPTVAVVLGNEGTNVADSLAPYEVFATTGAFNVYAVAAGPDPVPLTGGLDLLPDLTFEELDALVGEGPDVIVVPQVHTTGELKADPVVAWLRRQADQGDPILMSVCVGAKVLAAAGLLDGRPATSNWLALIGLRRSNPEVEWRDGVRFVDDGNLITTGAVLSGMDGSLRVVERMLGPEVASRVSHRLEWDGYVPGGTVTIPRNRPAPSDLVALLSAAYRWDRPRTGVLLTDGVGEIELASALRPYTEMSFLANLVTVTTDGNPVRSRHGLVFLPRADLATAVSSVDRVLVPGSDAASRGVHLGDSIPPGVDVVYLHQADGFPFDGALTDIARTYDAATARWVAKSLQYPMVPLDSTSYRDWPWLLTVRPLALGVLAMVAGLGLVHLRRRHRSRSLRTP